MASSGFQSSMAKSLKSNAKLLNRNNLFNQLKEIENSEVDSNVSLLSEEELIDLRKKEKALIRKNQIKRRIIGIFVIIPISIILLFGVYVLIQALF